MYLLWSAVAQWENVGLAIGRARVRIPLCYNFKARAFSFSPQCLSPLNCINEYLAIGIGGNVSEQSLQVIAALLECGPEKWSWCQNRSLCGGGGKSAKH